MREAFPRGSFPLHLVLPLNTLSPCLLLRKPTDQSTHFRYYTASCDPHDLPGVLHLAEDINNLQGALETSWQPINSTSCPSQSYVNQVASLNASTSTSLPKALYNRTILLIGDSVDRANNQYTCHLLSGNYTITKPGHPYWAQDDIPDKSAWKPNQYSERSFPTICHVESVDLFIMNVFHFGLDEEDYFTWKDQYGPPYTVEERIEQIALPLIEKVGRKVDILEFSSGVSLDCYPSMLIVSRFLCSELSH